MALGRVDRLKIEASDSGPVSSIEEKLLCDTLSCLEVLIILWGLEGTVDVTLHSKVERRVRVCVEGVWLSTASEQKLDALHLTSIE